MGPLSEGEQNRLIIEFVGLVEPIAAGYRGRKNIPFEDLVAQGHRGLVQAARGYLANRSRFQTYATHKIHGAIMEFVRTWQEAAPRDEEEVERDWHEWQVWPHIAPFESWTALAATPEDLLSRHEEISGKHRALASALIKFGARDRGIFAARFKRGQTLDSIARHYKISYAKTVRILDAMLASITETVDKIEQRKAVA